MVITIVLCCRYRGDFIVWWLVAEVIIYNAIDAKSSAFCFSVGSYSGVFADVSVDIC